MLFALTLVALLAAVGLIVMGLVIKGLLWLAIIGAIVMIITIMAGAFTRDGHS